MRKALIIMITNINLDRIGYGKIDTVPINKEIQIM